MLSIESEEARQVNMDDIINTYVSEKMVLRKEPVVIHVSSYQNHQVIFLRKDICLVDM